jgi:predicted phosphodiesterase
MNEIKTIKINVTSSCEQIAICGGPYSNFEAVKSFLAETADIKYRFCLGDLGGFGPQPNKTIELLKKSDVICLQGNYDYAVGFSEAECGCGYLDPRDRHFAQVSFDYTLANTSEEHKPWLKSLPQQIEVSWKNKKILLCHGSPVEVNEFVWESETSNDKITKWLNQFKVDGFCATHSGLPWIRNIDEKGFWFNVGVLGRPPHDGQLAVCYGVIQEQNGQFVPKLKSLDYDFKNLVEEMKSEKLPTEFIESVEQGIWTTCLQILPPSEREIKRRV